MQYSFYTPFFFKKVYWKVFIINNIWLRKNVQYYQFQSLLSDSNQCSILCVLRGNPKPMVGWHQSLGPAQYCFSHKAHLHQLRNQLGWCMNINQPAEDISSLYQVPGKWGSIGQVWPVQRIGERGQRESRIGWGCCLLVQLQVDLSGLLGHYLG